MEPGAEGCPTSDTALRTGVCTPITTGVCVQEHVYVKHKVKKQMAQFIVSSNQQPKTTGPAKAWRAPAQLSELTALVCFRWEEFRKQMLGLLRPEGSKVPTGTELTHGQAQ